MSGTFLGMPPFPDAARAALADTQLRHNLAHATGIIRAKRAAVVAEVPDLSSCACAGRSPRTPYSRTWTRTSPP